jgi:hypothetical protein
MAALGNTLSRLIGTSPTSARSIGIDVDGDVRWRWRCRCRCRCPMANCFLTSSSPPSLSSHYLLPIELKCDAHPDLDPHSELDETHPTTIIQPHTVVPIALGTAAFQASIYDVPGGYRAVMFDRFSGVKSEVSLSCGRWLGFWLGVTVADAIVFPSSCACACSIAFVAITIVNLLPVVPSVVPLSFRPHLFTFKPESHLYPHSTSQASGEGTHFLVPWLQKAILYDVRIKPRVSLRFRCVFSYCWFFIGGSSGWGESDGD